jgi:hypothetical protein
MVPEPMRRRGRPADPEFEPSECLFYRFEGGRHAIGSVPRGLEVRSPDFSVNREKHGGVAEYVLFPDWPDWGIAEFKVGSIPAAIASTADVLFSWSLQHEPEEENYFHSGISTLKSGVPCRKSSQVSELVKKEFRQTLAEKMLVVREFQGDEF